MLAPLSPPYVYPGRHPLWELQPVSKTWTPFPEAWLAVINQAVQIACFVLKSTSASVCVIFCCIPRLSWKRWHDLGPFLVVQAAEGSQVLQKSSLWEQRFLPQPCVSGKLQDSDAFPRREIKKSLDCCGDSGYPAHACTTTSWEKTLSVWCCGSLPASDGSVAT